MSRTPPQLGRVPHVPEPPTTPTRTPPPRTPLTPRTPRSGKTPTGMQSFFGEDAVTSPVPVAPAEVEPMCIGIFHGYELSGSGSNEYTKYVARGLARLGHHVHVLCRDREPAALSFVRAAVLWSLGGPGGLTPSPELMFLRDEGDLPNKETQRGGSVTVHVLPHGPIRPVFVCDKQRAGDVRPFVDLTDAELQEYHRISVAAVTAVLRRVPIQVLHANHLVYQPSICADACAAVGVPFIIYPHGSSIEYTVHADKRYEERAKVAVAASAMVISGSQEVANRIEALYHTDTNAGDAAGLAAYRAKQSIVGVGTDTSLFRDLSFGKRAAKIANVESFSSMFGGKTARQSQEMFAALDAEGTGPQQWFATLRAYKKAYNHKLPDVEFFDRLSALPWAHRAAVAQCPIIMFLGAMTVGKGIQTLITSFTELLADYPSSHLLIIGSGSYRETLEALVHALATGNGALLDFIIENGVNLDAPAAEAPAEPLTDLALHLPDAASRQRLMATAQAHKLKEHVHFLGRVNHDLLSNVFPCTDIAVFPSMRTEAYPLVLMESLANGVVPVLPDHSGFSESLRSLREPMGDAFVDSITMPSAPEERVSGLARVLRGLVASLGDVRALTPKLRHIAVTRYDWGQRCVELTAQYQRVARPAPDDGVDKPLPRSLSLESLDGLQAGAGAGTGASATPTASAGAGAGAVAGAGASSTRWAALALTAAVALAAGVALGAAVQRRRL